MDPPTESTRRQAARDEVLIAAVASGMAYADAGELAGCSARTVARRMQDAAFRSAVDERRDRWVFETTGGLLLLGTEAIIVLDTLLHHAKQEVQIRAVHEVLSQGFKSRQLNDLTAEVREIRRQLDLLRSGNQEGGNHA